MKKVVCIGEMLIDFVPETNGLPLAEVPGFRKAAGGAPANVAAAVARLGGGARFIGKVGADPFGEFLRAELERTGAEAAMIASEEARTALAFVSLRADGERDFLFYRQPSADMLLRPEDIREEWLADAAIIHFGSVSLIEEPSRSATLSAVQRVGDGSDAIVSYDPNVRLALWPDQETAKRSILEQMPLAHLVKVSEEEVEFLLGTEDIAAGARQLLAMGPLVVIVTLGAEGCVVYTNNKEIRVAAPKVEAVDTTGAGDGFVGGLLYELAGRDLTANGLAEAMSNEKVVHEAAGFACRVGALTTTKRGAIPALPTKAEVEAFEGSND
ncbi:PfkB family carbohydrate kinase [Paenibacillus turpanensis]|uniref:PfkB family carbohydrate kinase n=1 Tax=Paenibacillus turpanensis TaxID=2689078 RepID=UPI00140E9634|nr:PfkB family carbohydrate kinase [Paenibacillus turpanensis]